MWPGVNKWLSKGQGARCKEKKWPKIVHKQKPGCKQGKLNSNCFQAVGLMGNSKGLLPAVKNGSTDLYKEYNLFDL